MQINDDEFLKKLKRRQELIKETTPESIPEQTQPPESKTDEEELKNIEGMLEKTRNSITRKICFTLTACKSITFYIGDSKHSNMKYVSSPEIKVTIIMVDKDDPIILVKDGKDVDVSEKEKEKEKETEKDKIELSYVGEGTRISIDELNNICSDTAFYLRKIDLGMQYTHTKHFVMWTPTQSMILPAMDMVREKLSMKGKNSTLKFNLLDNKPVKVSFHMGVKLEHIASPKVIEGSKQVVKEPLFTQKLVELFSFLGLSRHKIDLVCCNYTFPIQSQSMKYLGAQKHYEALVELTEYINKKLGQTFITMRKTSHGGCCGGCCSCAGAYYCSMMSFYALNRSRYKNDDDEEEEEYDD
jgi:hypothetical protein